MHRSFLRIPAALIALFLLNACRSTIESEESVETSESAATSPTAWGATCATVAVDITPAIAAGQAYQGTVSAAPSLGISTCGNRTERAALLRYDLPSYGNYRVDVKSALPTSDPRSKDAAVVVRSDCSSITGEIACNPAAADKSTFVGYHLSGPVYIRVEGAFYSSGFELSITKLPFECMSDSQCSDWPNGKCNQLNGNCISHLQCRGSLGNCDRDWDNGCETDLSTSAEHCGACNSECSTAGGHASAAACTAGKCALTCDTGFADCDGYAKTGCEADLANEGLSCGACGTTCGGGVCRSGACETTGELVTDVPVSGGSWSDKRLEALAVGEDHVFASTGDYVGKLWAAKKTGGPPTKLSDHGEAFEAANGAVVWANYGKIERWNEATQVTTTLGSTARPEWIQALTTDGTNVFIGYRDSEGIGVLRPGSASVEPFWGTTETRVARLAMSGSDVVARPVGWSGYGYNAYSQKLTVVDGTTAATLATTASTEQGYSSNATFAADATDVFFGSTTGLWRVPLSGAPGTKIWAGGPVFSVALDGPDVYFVVCLDGRRAARGLRVSKSGGAAEEVVFDEIAAPEKGVYMCKYRPSSRFLVTDAQYVYWVNGTTIRRVKK